MRLAIVSMYPDYAVNSIYLNCFGKVYYIKNVSYLGSSPVSILQNS